jgi:2-keto-3-deoxy-L-rhamnonate aldolase RhmA
MLGPADFSILSGFPGDFGHPMLMQAMEKIAAAARNTGKHWSRTVANLEHAKQALDMGARILFHNADIVMVKNALEQMQQQFAPLGFRFDNRLKGPSRSYLGN